SSVRFVLRSFDPLTQFDQHAVAGRRMQESHAASMRAGHRRLVDQSKSLLLQSLEMGLEICHTKADVMDALAAFRDELRDRRFRRKRLEQLEIRIADIDERRLY